MSTAKHGMNGCTIDDCSHDSHARGMCKTHYARWRKHGDPRKGIRINPAQEFLANFLATAEHPDECVIWPFCRNYAGRAKIGIDGKTQYVHHVVCAKVYGPPPTPKHLTAHSCGNGHLGCINPKHLRWATHRENMDEAVAHGTMNRGESNHSAKLTEAAIPLIREMRGTHKAVGLEFGVSPSTIQDVRTGRKWGWVP